MANSFIDAAKPLDLSPANVLKLPYFLLDLGADFFKEPLEDKVKPKESWGWRIIIIEDFIQDANNKTLLAKSGYGAISYGWGAHEANPRPSYDEKNRFVPAFPKAPYKWRFPEIWDYPTPDGPGSGTSVKQSLDFDHVRAVFRTMRKRFVWWDHACIPQEDATQGWGSVVPLDPILKTRRSQEVEKQKVVYQFADVGAAWIHQITWRSDNEFDISKILLKAASQQLPDLETFRDLKKFNSTEATIKGTPRAMLAAVLGSPTDAPTWCTAVNSFLDSLEKIKAQEYWFRSLWCFQEGALLRPQAFLDYNGKLLGFNHQPSDPAAVDVKPYPIIKDPKGNEVNAPCYLHITGCTTLLSNMISTVLLNADDPKAAREVVAVAKGGNVGQVTGIEFLKTVRRRLGDSGLMFYAQNSPLEMLASARSSRSHSRYWQDQYFAMIGVLGLNDSILKVDYSQTQAAHELDLQKDFFAQILSQYQWPTLLLAKSTNETIKSWAAVSAGNFEPIGDFVPGVYPGKDAPVPSYQYSLSYDKATDEVVITPPASSKIIPCWRPNKGSAALMEIDPKNPVAAATANEILFTSLDFTSQTFAGKTNWCLLPFQRLLGPNEKEPPLSTMPFQYTPWQGSDQQRNARCLYLEKWDDNTRSGVYRGVVDIKQADMKAGTDAIDLKADVRMKWT